jgi:outer membrane protein TolC
MWQAGIGVRLPLARKARAAALAEAQARLAAADRRAAALQLQLRYRTEQRLAEIRSAERIAVLYESGIIPQDRMSVEAAIASYQAGKVPFVAVLEALGTLYDDRSTHLRLVAGHARARASLEEASLEPTADLPGVEARPGAGAGAPMGGGAGASGSMSMNGR